MHTGKAHREDQGIRCRPAAVGGCLAALLLALSGCTGHKKPALTEEEIRQYKLAHKPDRPDELLVSGEKVTFDDVLSLSPEANAAPTMLKDKLMEMARQMPEEVFVGEVTPAVRQRLNNNISNMVLYKRARKELGAKTDDQLDKMVEKELRRFTIEHGGDAAADAALQKMGLSRERFKEHKKKQALGQYYIASKFPYNRPITHRELLECYEKMKTDAFFQAGLIQFRLIDIQIAKVPASDASDGPVQAARTLATAVMERLRTGDDFAALARQYSHDPRGASGGLWPEWDPDSLAPPYDVLGKKAGQMKPGEVAGPIEVRDHVFILKLEKKQERGYRPLTEVQDKVEEEVLADRRRVALEQLDVEVRELVAAGNTDRFVDSCVRNLYRQARTPAQVP